MTREASGKISAIPTLIALAPSARTAQTSPWLSDLIHPRTSRTLSDVSIPAGKNLAEELVVPNVARVRL